MFVCMCERYKFGKISVFNKFPISMSCQGFNELEMCRATLTECRTMREGRSVLKAMEKGWREEVSE